MKEGFLNDKLIERKKQNAFRYLKLPDGKVDFCSNDYLGVVKNNLIQKDFDKSEWNVRELKHGSTGSRLLSGNYSLIKETEKQIASFHQAESGLIFNSGYDANIGLLSSIPQKGDTIVYDHLSHASLRDGIRLSFAKAFSFQHNDLYDLEKKLKHSSGNIFVVTESVFSMDGDEAPLIEMATLCEKYNAHLIVDEAHATGVVGERGEGCVQNLQLQHRMFVRIHTFGKALGCHGAIVLGSEMLMNYLINFARSFIYTTALPESSIGAIKKSYEIFPLLTEERKHLNKLISQFQNSKSRFSIYKSNTPIQIVEIPGNREVKTVADLLNQNNLDVRPILYPSVPKEKERLRIVLHSFNTEQEVENLCRLLR
ncbi:MAG TPA: pyridoxal phosphate-dependent aminotransferase family protein [Chitinophagaceae bacterium]|nr:pyridoxal phosphate-dependent aminotransferase family protein [Chitinophagaceae bacterium]